MMQTAAYGTVLNPHEVAKLLKVSYRTVCRWDRQGRLDTARTEWPHRYAETEIRALMAQAESAR